MEGLIVKALSGFYYVKTEEETVECRARGRFRLDGSSPLVGDRVSVSLDAQGRGRVDEILPRKNMFIRPAVANIDALVAVASAAEPETDPFLIDRVAATAERAGCEVIVCINKADRGDAGRLASLYADTGYSVVVTSAAEREGIEELRVAIEGKICAFSGNSGVGKSSLLNALEPSLALPTGEISEKLGRGRHTTRHVELFRVAGALVADTPGFGSFDVEQMPPIPREELQYCFPEFAPYIGKCRFDDCAHLKEPDCAVREALAGGRIAAERYRSYERLYEISSQMAAPGGARRRG